MDTVKLLLNAGGGGIPGVGVGLGVELAVSPPAGGLNKPGRSNAIPLPPLLG